MFMIILLNFVLAVTFLISRTATLYTQPLFFAALRCIVAGAVMLVVEEAREKGVSQLFFVRRRALKGMLVLTLLYGYLATVCISIMTPYLTSAKSNLIWSFAPFVTAILSYLLYKERLGVGKIAGIVVAFAGFLPSMVATDNIPSVIGGTYIPEVVAFLGTILMAYSWFLVNNAMKEGSSSFLINGFTMTFGGIFLLITSYFYEQWGTTQLVTHWGMFIGLLVGMSVLSNGVYCNLQAFLMKRYSLTFITLSGFLAPLFGGVLGWVILGEPITWSFYVAIVAVGVGLYLFTRE